MKYLLVVLLISCSTTRMVSDKSKYTMDASKFKVEQNTDSLLKYLNRWGTVSHYNFDSLNKIYHFKTATISYTKY